MNIFAETWAYLTDPANWQGSGGLWARMLEQLLLTGTALVLAVVIGLPIALWLGHLGRGGFLAINISNVGRAIPTFALLALLVTADWPGTASFGPYGRAGLATLIALTLFALPPIITQSYTAIREVADDVKESARGMGMTSSQQFFRVELPLGLPLVMSGIRLALVQVWATATIAALVAGPGPGPHHHRRLLPVQLPPGHRRRDRGRPGRAGARAGRGRRPAGARPDPVGVRRRGSRSRINHHRGMMGAHDPHRSIRTRAARPRDTEG